MRAVSGYVCRAEFEWHEPLFRTAVNSGLLYAENLNTNNLTLFCRKSDAVAACPHIIARGASSCRVMRLRMSIAETDAEFQLLARKRRLMIIPRDTSGCCYIYGRPVEGKPRRTVPCADMCQNGFAPFLSFEQALHAVREEKRQGQHGVLIGTWSMSEIKN